MTPNTRIAKFGLKKSVLSLTDTHDCSKCKLFKAGEAPVFRAEPERRASDDEKIIVLLHNNSYGRTAVFNDAQQAVISEAVRNLKGVRVIPLPVVFCAHTKDPTKLMITKCQSRLEEHLRAIKPNVIVSLGKGPCNLFNVTGNLNKLKMGMLEIHGLPQINGENPKLIVTNPVDKVLEDYSLRVQLREDLQKAVRLCTKSSEIQVPDHYFLIESPEELETWVKKLVPLANNYILAADIETNGRSFLSGRGMMRCISFCWRPGHAICVPFELDPEGYLPVLKNLFSSEVRLVWHNGMFDVPFLKNTYKLFSEHNYADTMMDAYLLRPGKGKYGYGLKGLALQYTDLGAYDTEINEEEDDEEVTTRVEQDALGNDVFVEEEGQNKWEKIPLETLATYNCGDVDATWQIFHIFRRELAAKKMIEMSRIMAECELVVMDMETNGCLIDTEMVQDAIPQLEVILQRYDEELTAIVGEKYDWNSSKELAILLYDKLHYKSPYGPASRPTDDTTLEIIDTPFTRTMRKYRKASKLCGTYFKGYFSKIECDGRLHGRFWLNETATGRLSSSDPNMQNLPRGMASYEPGYDDLHHYKAKNAIMAPEGWTLVAADQSQAEMRVAGMLSGDPELIRSYRNGIDLHSLNAKVCFDLKIDLTEVKKAMLAEGYKEGTEAYDLELLKRELKIVKRDHGAERTAAKSVSFGILYGMSEFGLKFDLDGKTRQQGKIWTVDECRIMIKRFHANFRVLSRWLESQKAFVKKNGYIANAFGFRRPIPEVYSDDPKDKTGALRKAVNTPVQGTASIIMVLGIATARRRLDPTRAKLIMTVHDSVVLEVRDDYVDEAIKILRESLTNPIFEGKPLSFLSIPLAVDVEKGQRYGSLEEVPMDEAA